MRKLVKWWGSNNVTDYLLILVVMGAWIVDTREQGQQDPQFLVALAILLVALRLHRVVFIVSMSDKAK